MGIDPYLLSTSLIGVMAQRLLRKVCPHCKTKVSTTEDELAVIHGYLGQVGTPNLIAARAVSDAAAPDLPDELVFMKSSP